MSIMLPSELDWVLELLGYNWPNIDEDKLFACAQAWRDFASDVTEAQSSGSGAANAVLSANSGEAIEKFGEEWGKFTGGFGHDSYLTDAQVASEVIAVAFDAAAAAVIAGKVAVIAQLIALAAEIIAAQAAAPFTFGLSELGALGATQATRLIIRELLDKLKKEVMEAAAKAAEHATMDAIKKMVKDFAKDYVKDTIKEVVVEGAKDKVKEAATEMATNLEEQAIKQHFGAQDGWDFSQTADIAKEKAGEYADDVSSLADPSTHVDNLTSKPVDYAQDKFNHYAEQAGQHASDGLHQAAGEQPASSTPSNSSSENADRVRADFG